MSDFTFTLEDMMAENARLQTLVADLAGALEQLVVGMERTYRIQYCQPWLQKAHREGKAALAKARGEDGEC